MRMSRFTTEEPEGINYDGCDWKDVKFDFNLPEVMKNLGLFVGEPETCIYADMNGERLPLYGGLLVRNPRWCVRRETELLPVHRQRQSWLPIRLLSEKEMNAVKSLYM